MKPARSYSFGRIEAGHLRRLAADQGAAVVLAGLGHPADDLFGHLGIELADGQVVHEEQRRGALHHDVVDAVVHQVAADGVVQVHLEGELQLGAHAVYAGDQHRVLELLLVHLEQPAVAADLAQHVLVEGAVGEILDALLGTISPLDVNAGVGVGDALEFLFHLSARLQIVAQWGCERRLYHCLEAQTAAFDSAG